MSTLSSLGASNAGLTYRQLLPVVYTFGDREYLMPDFKETMQLKEKAAEDIYFAKRDQELIRALHDGSVPEDADSRDVNMEREPEDLQNEDAPVTRKRWSVRGRYFKHLKTLIAGIFKRV